MHARQEEARPGQGSLGCRLWPLDRPLSFEHEVDLDVAPALPAPAKGAGSAIKWNARVRAQPLTLRGSVGHRPPCMCAGTCKLCQTWSRVRRSLQLPRAWPRPGGCRGRRLRKISTLSERPSGSQ